MNNFLQRIVEQKKRQIEAEKQLVAPAEMVRRGEEAARSCPVPSMADALHQSASGIIAEFKRKSPSLGWFRPDAKVEEILPAYERGGATAASVLTDEPFFGGSNDFLTQAHRITRLPLLRKDFIIDDYQIYQARSIGASAILLIAACLSPSRCAQLAHTARKLGLDVLLEVHEARELDCYNDEVNLLGVNNRNLTTFQTDASTSMRLLAELPVAPVWVSESGLSHPADVSRLRRAGYRGFLMGEHFMKADHPEAALRDFIQAVSRHDY